MARRGGFGGSLNPLGAGSIGSFSAYDIGTVAEQEKQVATAKKDNAAALRAYKIEVAWANGEASDDDYLASLNQQLATTTDPGTRLSIENKIHDAEYSIGHARAEAGGLDSVIAFEQRTLAGMDPGNYRAVNLRASIESHLAERRSRDYSAVVARYNDDLLSTEQLVSYVAQMVRSVPAGAPDADNWRATLRELTDRLANERDAQVRQDNQMGRITDEQYLAYMIRRRDSYSTVSPKWDEWNRYVEDATRTIEQNRVNAQDAAFFREVDLGHKSDASYLLYLRRRLDGMAPDDPKRAQFEKQFQDSTFSLAEDKLRYDVEHKRRPVKDLIDFYTAYQATLNPGSKLWRDTQNMVESLREKAKKHGGGGSGVFGGNALLPAAGVPGVPVPKMGGKVVPAPRQSLAVAITDLSQTMTAVAQPGVKSKSTNVAGDVLDLNIATLSDAVQRGQNWWLYTDPRNPNALTNELDPMTGDPTGRRIRGTRYYKADESALADLYVIKSGFLATQSETARATGKSTTYITKRKESREWANRAIEVDATVGLKAVLADLSGAKRRIDGMEARNDLAGAVAEAVRIDAITDAALNSPYSPYQSQEQRDRIASMIDDVTQRPTSRDGAYDPYNTYVEWTDAAGIRHTSNLVGLSDDRGVVNPSFAEAAVAGKVRVTSTALNPGWFHTVNASDKPTKGGDVSWGLVYDPELAKLNDPTLTPDKLPFVNGQKWVPIVTMDGDVVIRSYAKVSASKLALPGSTDPADVTTAGPLLRIDATDEQGRKVGSYTVPVADVARSGSVLSMGYYATNGKWVTAYSLDGQAWIRPEDGAFPILTWRGSLRVGKDKDGTPALLDGNGTAMFTVTAQGTATPTKDYNATAAQALGWLGENDAKPVRVWSPQAGRYVTVWNTGGYVTGGTQMGATEYVDAQGNWHTAPGGVFGGTWNSVTTITADSATGTVDMTPTAEQYYRANSLPAHLEDWMESTYERRLRRPQGPTGELVEGGPYPLIAGNPSRFGTEIPYPLVARRVPMTAKQFAMSGGHPASPVGLTTGDLIRRKRVLDDEFGAQKRPLVGDGTKADAATALPPVIRTAATIRPFALPTALASLRPKPTAKLPQISSTRTTNPEAPLPKTAKKTKVPGTPAAKNRAVAI